MATRRDARSPILRCSPQIPVADRLDDPRLYFNRELSQLQFIWRVLDQALDPETPLLERLRFLTITSAILDGLPAR